MKGSMRERSKGVWELRVYAGRDPVSKRPRQISRTFHGGKRAASTELSRLVAEASDGRMGGTNATVETLLDAWLASAKATVSGSSYAVYERTADLLKTTDLSLVRLNRLGAHDIDAAYAQLRDKGATDHIMVQVHRYLGTALRQAVRWGWTKSNPVEQAKAPRKPKIEPKAMSLEDIRALVVEVQKTDPELAGIIFLAAATGLRRGELCGLKWSDIDGDVLTVARSHAIVKGAVEVGGAKMHRPGETETVVLDPLCLGALEVVRDAQGARCRELSSPVPKDGYVLSTDGMGHSPRRPDRMGREIREAGQRIGVVATPHRLRHFMATNLIASGVDVAAVASRMRHKDKALTLRTYVHDDGARAMEAAAILGEALTAHCADDNDPNKGD